MLVIFAYYNNDPELPILLLNKKSNKINNFVAFNYIHLQQYVDKKLTLSKIKTILTFCSTWIADDVKEPKTIKAFEITL